MNYVPVLSIQRNLYQKPRDFGRFSGYLSSTLNAERNEVELMPLVGMNPMAKPHLLPLLEALLALGAEDIAENAMQEAQTRLNIDNPVRVSLVLFDNLGGWSDQASTEAASLRQSRSDLLKRPWISVGLWSNDPLDAKAVHSAVLTSIFRWFYLLAHDTPKTLAEFLQQEAAALAFAGQCNWLDGEETAYTRAVIAPYLPSSDYPTQFACIFGDEAARAIGYTPLGLGYKAAIAVMLDQP
jgi:hypothetical protein